MSPYENPKRDYIQIMIVDPKVFVGMNPLMVASKTNDTRSVPKQIPNGSEATRIKSVSYLVKIALITSTSTSFVLNLVLAASLQQVVGMMGVLQILCFHTLISIEFP